MFKKINDFLRKKGILELGYTEVNQVQLAEAFVIKKPKLVEDSCKVLIEITPEIKAKVYTLCGASSRFMDVDILVNGILTTKYNFAMDRRPFSSEVDRDSSWRLFKKKIIHPLPNEIANVINAWSQNIVSRYNNFLMEQQIYEQHKADLANAKADKELSVLATQYREKRISGPQSVVSKEDPITSFFK